MAHCRAAMAHYRVAMAHCSPTLQNRWRLLGEDPTEPAKSLFLSPDKLFLGKVMSLLILAPDLAMALAQTDMQSGIQPASCLFPDTLAVM